MKQAIGKLKIGKVLGVDGIRAEMLKYEGEAIVIKVHGGQVRDQTDGHWQYCVRLYRKR